MGASFQPYGDLDQRLHVPCSRTPHTPTTRLGGGVWVFARRLLAHDVAASGVLTLYVLIWRPDSVDGRRPLGLFELGTCLTVSPSPPGGVTTTATPWVFLAGEETPWVFFDAQVTSLSGHAEVKVPSPARQARPFAADGFRRHRRKHLKVLNYVAQHPPSSATLVLNLASVQRATHIDRFFTLHSLLARWRGRTGRGNSRCSRSTGLSKQKFPAFPTNICSTTESEKGSNRDEPIRQRGGARRIQGSETCPLTLTPSLASGSVVQSERQSLLRKRLRRHHRYRPEV